MTNSLNPDRTVLQSLHLATAHPSGDCTLTLRLSRETDPVSPTLELRFTGVTGLALDGLGGGFQQFAHLQAQDIAGEQLDRVRWRVTEFEHEGIEFQCHDFEVRNVNSTHRSES